MNKPTLTTTKKTKDEQLETALNTASIIAASLCAILVVEFVGIAFMKLFHYPIHGFIYNFVFGFGIITGVAFILAVIQEIFEK